MKKKSRLLLSSPSTINVGASFFAPTKTEEDNGALFFSSRLFLLRCLSSLTSKEFGLTANFRKNATVSKALKRQTQTTPTEISYFLRSTR